MNSVREIAVAINLLKFAYIMYFSSMTAFPIIENFHK